MLQVVVMMVGIMVVIIAIIIIIVVAGVSSSSGFRFVSAYLVFRVKGVFRIDIRPLSLRSFLMKASSYFLHIDTVLLGSCGAF